MKIKILIAFLVLPFCGKAQIESNENVYPLYRIPNGSVYKPPTMVDTVKCIMLVCDTSYTKRVYWINGYEVRVCEFICCDPSEKFLAKNYWSCDHVEYLDENKKPLSKNIIVWMSKNTEP